jgi:hypothetical protein
VTGQHGQSMTARHPATLGEDDVAATVARASGGEAGDVAKQAAAGALRGRFNHRDFRILGLAASLRRASFHRGIVRAAHEVAPEWMSCEDFDLARIPYFDQA